MVLVGRWAWRGAGGGRRRGEGGGCDARARGAHAGSAGVRCGRCAGIARAAGGRAHRVLLGDRRTAFSRRCRARLQSHPQRDIENLPCRRLPTLPAQYHAAATLYRATRR